MLAWTSTWWNDARAALRLPSRKPRFSGFVVLTLAVAIGAGTLIFSFVNVLVLQPLPIRDPARVVLVFGTNDRRGVARGAVSLPDFADWRAETTSFEALAASDVASFTLGDTAGPVRVRARRATADLFRAWGLEPFLGRTFDRGEDAPGAPPVVVLAHGFWARRFASDPAIVGRSVAIDGREHTVVGVLSPEIEIGTLALTDVWVPLPLDVAGAPRGERSLQVTGRLAPGVSVERAGSELAEVARRLAETHPATDAGWGVSVQPFRRAMAIPQTWLVLSLAGLAVALVLAVACANVASLMLARGVERRQEMAVRLALGASRAQVARPMLFEALLLALAGGAGGVLLARAGLGLVRAVTFHPFFRQVRIDGRVLGVALALSLATPLLFALGPALAASRLRLQAVLQRGGARSLGGRGSQRAYGLLVVGQIALALVLVVVSVLTVRTAIALDRADLGFDRTHTLALRVDLPPAGYATPAALDAFAGRLVGRLAALPGVEAAGVASRLPALDREAVEDLAIEGRAAGEPGERPWAAVAAVGGGYFRAMDIPLLAGRAFAEGDRRGAAGVALVGAETARRYWGGPERALGAHLLLGGEAEAGPAAEVVGVVGDVRGSAADDAPRPMLYLPLAQRSGRRLVFVVRAAGSGGGPTSGTVADLVPGARSALRELDPNLAAEVRPVADLFFESQANDRLTAGFFAAFAAVALLLAAGGLYGLMAYSVVQRSGEIGLRMVLGAHASDVLSMVLRRGLGLAAAGVALGLAAALPFALALRGLVHGVDPRSPALYAGVAGLILALAALATTLPAARAARVDPAQALRGE